jgi:hypothetical protein
MNYYLSNAPDIVLKDTGKEKVYIYAYIDTDYYITEWSEYQSWLAAGNTPVPLQTELQVFISSCPDLEAAKERGKKVISSRYAIAKQIASKGITPEQITSQLFVPVEDRPAYIQKVVEELNAITLLESADYAEVDDSTTMEGVYNLLTSETEWWAGRFPQTPFPPALIRPQ